MHRHQLLRALERYANTWPLFEDDPFARDRARELSTLQRFKIFLNSEPSCFERSCLAGHVTGSALVTDTAMERVLLTHHRKLNMWLQLGGHADGNARVHEVAMTEAQEESGLTRFSFFHVATCFAVPGEGDQIPFDLDIHQIPANKKDASHLHYDVRYVLIADDGQEPIISDESHDLRWFTLDEARMVTKEPSMLRQFSKLEHLRRIRA